MSIEASFDVETYRRDGYVGPLRLFPADDMPEIERSVRSVLATTGIAPPRSPEQEAGRLAEKLGEGGIQSVVPYIECRHLDSRAVYEISTNSVIIDLVSSILGPDILLWRSTFIAKPAGVGEFSWHQDYGGVYSVGTEYGLEPPLHVSIWLAVTKASKENGCLRFVPRTRAVLPTVISDGVSATPLLDVKTVDEGSTINMELEPGQFVIFSDRVVHSSWPNTSGSDRLGLALRFTAPFVKVRPHFRGHRPVLVSGVDQTGTNDLAPTPISS